MKSVINCIPYKKYKRKVYVSFIFSNLSNQLFQILGHLHLNININNIIIVLEVLRVIVVPYVLFGEN
jgi:hypothetical protein